MNNIYLFDEFKNKVNALIAATELSDRRSFLSLRSELISLLNEAVDVLFEADSPVQLSADSVCLEAVDKATGRLILRELPLTLIENANALRLIGEGLNREPSEIVFLSGSAVSMINELTGHGPDKPRCKD